MKKKSQLPQSLVHESRMPIFQPTRRPKDIKKWEFASSQGKLEISGKIGQAHRDLIDSIMTLAEDYSDINGRLEVVIDPYKLKKLMSSGGRSINDSNIKALLADLKKTDVVAKVKTKNEEVSIYGSIVLEYGESKKERPTQRKNTFTTEVVFIKVLFGETWTTLMKKDIELRYNLPKVIGLKYGITQAMTRYCLSHKRVHDTIAGLIAKLGVNLETTSPRMLYKYEKQIEEEKQEMKELGVEVTDIGTIHYGPN
jgi:hypothetical protein